jgi:hypothetical protein
MSGEIGFTTGLTCTKGGASIGDVPHTGPQDMAGTFMGSDVQSIDFAADVALALPAGITGDRLLEIFSMEPPNGNHVQVSTGTGGGFAGGVHDQISPQTSIFRQPKGTLHLKAIQADGVTAATTPVLIQFRACQK